MKSTEEELHRLKTRKEAIINEREKGFEYRRRPEYAVSLACKDAPEIILDMLAKEKVSRLGNVITDIRKENKELQARMVPRTPPEWSAERKDAIEEVVIEIIELEKVVQVITKDNKILGNSSTWKTVEPTECAT